MITRSKGRSAVAASAYMSCSKITNEYDGITHDYTHKHGLVWEHIYLPPNAPKEWKDRAKLWNAVEFAEQSRDSRLARELIVALPNELSLETNIGILEDFIMDECVAKGMCVDVCYHDTDGNNPHAHIMMTVRPLDKNGKWQAKTQKEYLCVKDGMEQGFTAAEFKTVEHEGWEKQYLYRIDEKTKVYLPPSRAEELERINRYPKATKYGRQNPVYEQWNSEEQLLQFREAWARYVNRVLDICEVTDRIDYRSYKAQGVDKTPTVHEGVSAKKMAVRGVISIRRKRNEYIRESNRLSDILVELTETLLKLVGQVILRIADGLETVRSELYCLSYKRNQIRRELNRCDNDAERQKQEVPRYRELEKLLSEKQAERDSTEKTLRQTPKIFKGKRTELEAKRYGLSEEINEIQHEMSGVENWIKHQYGDITKADKIAKQNEARISDLKPQKAECDKQINEKLTEYRKLQGEGSDLDQAKLAEARERLRPIREGQAINHIEHDCDGCYEDGFYDTAIEVAKLIGEKPPVPPTADSISRSYYTEDESDGEYTFDEPRQTERRSHGGWDR